MPVDPDETVSYDDAYYEEFNVGHAGYNVLRPTRKMLRAGFLLLPADARVCVFSVSHVGNFHKSWRRVFADVVGYDINPIMAKIAKKHNIPIYEQDVSVPFEPKMTGHLAVCHYLFEHLSDDQCRGVIANMINHAPLNVILLTHNEEPNYYEDPTHCNPKTVKQWSLFLRKEYGRLGWDFYKAQQGLWCFAHPKISYLLKSLPSSIAAHVDIAWSKVRIDEN